ncbi:homogentisate 1,2-dioxygenase [Sphingomonas sp. SUN019]|uniref:homogentisate 1,2-dioxygenase n=1 Tax=Sphingomonas sp. SUN019 TaxID=2937788 RepID=UPI00216464AC|nr:homogentisate 1,2-dioxygenase [Sphingomonas sp. SUN019]UVO52031.1 homogentisate 1,2-dioxygenase [Sphingomonas sp. SUN019]
MRPTFAVILALLPITAAVAQEPAAEASCANVRVALPAEFSGWSEQIPVSAGVKPGDGATVSVGKAANVSLHPAKHLALSPAPEKAAAVDSNGGTLAVSIVTAGTYRLALGGAAWVDLVQDGKAVASSAHDHGPKCTGVRKMVDFKLTPGTYAIQLSGSATPSLALMLVKLA